jgi:hypothetical protein
MSAIELENAYKQFKSNSETVKVLNNFCMNVQQGKM